MSTTELAIAEQQSMVMTPQQALGELRQLQEFVKSVMVEKVDYGVIPGTGGKNVLLQPGPRSFARSTASRRTSRYWNNSSSGPPVHRFFTTLSALRSCGNQTA